MKTLIVIPAFNEADNLAQLLPQLCAAVTADILVVDDFSSDGTVETVRNQGLTCLRLPLQLGAWGATQTGIRYAKRHDYDFVLTMDADGQHVPHEIAGLLKAANNHQYDVIIGTCPQRVSRLKKIAWRFFKIISQIRIEDLTSGFRVYNKKAIDVLADKTASLLDYQDVGVLLLLLRADLKITEIPVKMDIRKDGKSRVFSSWLVVFKYMLQTTTLCIANIGAKKSQ
ncbi:glycosyltransferase family 2 protein [Marinicella gelatinilytica]|uniref:glycosyltransferase family 2 protein n=1 Tax=Marinicella gelatinilytica TaxID=2996017 RepID=UPI002260F5EC|nr:glycosyltransferase family 2 protein [Marinicella gelatinilytica]MCX7544339.1 glycosyltransferase family 2 protein [Marinicella gelatinilytica]